MSVLKRHNVHVAGPDAQAMVFAHGFGCDQAMWRFVAPAFQSRFRTVLFDHIGTGGSDTSAYDPARHASLGGYADDVVEICRALGVEHGIFVGHSVSAMIGVLATRKAPDLFDALILVSPSPRYLDDGDYRGGFERAQMEELLGFLDENPTAWSQTMAPVIMSNPERPELSSELAASFCRSDPDIARRFARATFLADNRRDLEDVETRTLILQCGQDLIAPAYVGEYMHDRMRNSELVHLRATGHCPNLSAPEEVMAAIRKFL